MIRRSSFALVLLFGVAAAQPPPAKFTSEYQAGVDAFRLGKYDDARAHLEKARTLAPKLPGPYRFLAAVAQAQSRWDDCIDAARHALELNPASSEVGETRKLHDACRTSAGRMPYRGAALGEAAAIAVTANVDGATVRISGLTYGGTPLDPRPITAGAHEIAIVKLGYKPITLSIDALPGIVTDVAVDLVAAN
ncbi:MAG TPA: PEGA domain-containing protein [Kofleriaceae bacterium]|jgi:tetratricopeptide (TPR) repeat protein|nr:PEGA domain-containing protein [Kofleriaceae bacterium]